MNQHKMIVVLLTVFFILILSSVSTVSLENKSRKAPADRYVSNQQALDDDFPWAIFLPPMINSVPLADYGDAPDGTATGYPAAYAQVGAFPTLFASNGARTRDTGHAVLGTSASMERDADDPSDPDGMPNLTNKDSDNGINDFFITLNAIPVTADLFVDVTTPQTAQGGAYYLNVLIDLDMDGTWGGTAAGNEPEWVIKNYAVTAVSGSTLTIHPPSFAYGNGMVLPDNTFMRIALTSEQVTGSDWDGSGEFKKGEIEDHIVSIPDMKILNVNCGGPYTVPPPPPNMAIWCTVTNMGSLGGTFDYQLSPLTAGPRINVAPFTANPIAIGVYPANTALFRVTASDNGAGNMPCAWKISLTNDPPSVITPDGVTLGVGESSDTINFSEPTPPTIAVNGETDLISFYHEYIPGTSPCQENFPKNTVIEITNTGGGTLNWQIDPTSVFSDWLDVNPKSGTAPTQITLTFDCNGIYGTGGLNNFGIVGSDPNSGLPATNSPVINANWTLGY